MAGVTIPTAEKPRRSAYIAFTHRAKHTKHTNKIGGHVDMEHRWHDTSNNAKKKNAIGGQVGMSTGRAPPCSHPILL